MKKFLTLALALTLTFSLSACKGTDEKPPGKNAGINVELKELDTTPSAGVNITVGAAKAQASQ